MKLYQVNKKKKHEMLSTYLNSYNVMLRLIKFKSYSQLCLNQWICYKGRIKNEKYEAMKYLFSEFPM